MANNAEPAKLALINKEILEMKKKIQLSEGQRKALFEVCEAERKANVEEIKRLKKTNHGLVTSLHESKSHAVKYRMNTIRLETIVGPVAERNVDDIIVTVDLQIIDKRKQLDLLRFKKKQRQIQLEKLAGEYRAAISLAFKRSPSDKLTDPLKRSIRELQNEIHAVEVQLREAGHVRARYKSIRQTLMDDSGRFAGNIQTVEEELKNQRFDIDKLQEVAGEAAKMRKAARKMLLREEKLSLSAASLRDRQSIEGKRLLQEAKHELEKLERRIFMGGKSSQVRPANATNAVEEEQTARVETPSPQPFDEYLTVFDGLKTVTGGTTVKEVLDRFRDQKSTTNRLMHLRRANEAEKKKLEKRLEALTSELDKYKYSEARDSEKNIEQIEAVQKSIEEQNERRMKERETLMETEHEQEKIFAQLKRFYIELNPRETDEADAQAILAKIGDKVTRLKEMLRSMQIEEEEEPVMDEEIEDKWLPPPYTGLIRRTPIPQTGGSPIPPQVHSDEEDEVPSRSYLKRQAQLVVDAKSRRKNIRMLPKLK